VSVWAALDSLGADRVGHGIRSVDAPGLVAHLVEQQIPLEVCPTSNVRTRVVPDLASHPLPELVANGVVVCINTDDPPMFGTNLSLEYRAIAAMFGWGVDARPQASRPRPRVQMVVRVATATSTSNVVRVETMW
jgi:aminodeoxyfutalosine deaminase